MLEGHSVLIVGGGSGLGLGVARQCLGEGAELCILEPVEEKVAALRDAFGASVLVVQGSCIKAADMLRCRDEILRVRKKLDAVLCFQGVFDANLPIAKIPLDNIDALFDELFHLNVKGHILAAKVFHELLEESHGAMVLTSSTAAYAADGGGAMYSATKGAICSLVQQLAFEFAPNVRVNGVAPAGIANSQLRGPAALRMDHFKQSDIPKEMFLAKFQSISLLQELPEPEDYAFPYIFLASRLNKIMTGQTIVADQGLLNRRLLS